MFERLNWYAKSRVRQAARVLKKRIDLPFAVRDPGYETHAAALEALFPEQSPDDLRALYLEYLSQTELFAELDRAMVEARGRHAQKGGWLAFAYSLIRLEKPRTMIETGVFDGRSTAILLQAMENNGEGRLISIDLPATGEIFDSTHRMRETVLPPGKRPGWVIPDRLRHRHELIEGPAQDHLPAVLEGIDELDIFMHDSLHTYAHQTWEYRTAWPKLRGGGLLLSDDLYDNDAFFDWARQHDLPWVHVGAFAALRKPTGLG